MAYRQLLLFTSPAIEYITVSDTGAGSETVGAQERVAVAESGAGTEGLVTVREDVTVPETGAGSEAVATSDLEQIGVSETGAGSEQATIREDVVASESGLGSEALAIDDDIQIHEQGSGVETAGAADEMFADDSGQGFEVAGVTDHLPVVHDDGLGIDIAYLSQGEISLDGIALPHVLNIRVDEPSIVQDLPVMDALPYRKQLGKKGRSLTIQGWTNSLSTLETLRGYADGEKHLLVLPTGDSMNVLISDVRTPKNVESYDCYDYEMNAVEVVD